MVDIKNSLSAFSRAITMDDRPVVSILRLHGVLGGGSPIRGASLTISQIADTIDKAFSLYGLAAVALQINSPGGSPVQTAAIARHIRRVADEKKIPVLAFCEDVAASGGYWLACAADEIYADENSIVGSIGVVSATFGFQDMIAKLGIERRLYFSGDKKVQLDPFLPENKEEVKHLKALQSDIHDSFISYVKDRRKDHLDGKEDELFSGQFWTGKRAKDLGLVDGIGQMRDIMHERYGKDVNFRYIDGEKVGLRRFFRFSGEKRTAIQTATALGYLEDRLYWSRYGL